MMNPWFAVFPILLAVAVSGQDTVFKTETRLVEVYATVQDHHGKYVDGLTQDRFSILEDGKPQPIVAFESESATLACALLLDTTGSMQHALPSVKNAVGSFLDQMRPSDLAAAYSFNTSLSLLQDFTADREAVKRAVLRTRAEGNTALFDAIAQVAHDITPRGGKKAIIVFTDGGDNASVLRAAGAITRAKKTGIPVYAVAEGDALKSQQLLKPLHSIAEESGAQVYEARHLSDIEGIFRDILANVEHTYMLAYKPSAPSDSKWRTIQLAVDGLKNGRIHAKQGYFPE